LKEGEKKAQDSVLTKADIAAKAGKKPLKISEKNRPLSMPPPVILGGNSNKKKKKS